MPGESEGIFVGIQRWWREWLVLCVIETRVVAMELVEVSALEGGGEFVEEVQQLHGGFIGERRFGKPDGRARLIHRGLVV
jgi:hypothetical protein